MKFYYKPLLFVLILVSCKKSHKPEIIDPVNDKYPRILGVSNDSKHPFGIATLWYGDLMARDFIKENRDGLYLYGTHMHSNINSTEANLKGISFFGATYINNYARIIYSSTLKNALTPLSELAGIALAANSHETLTYHTTDIFGNTLICAFGRGVNDKKIDYYYEIDLKEKVTYHILPTRESDGFSGYSMIGRTGNEVLALRTTQYGSNVILTTTRENAPIKDLLINFPNYKQFIVRSTFIGANNMVYLLIEGSQVDTNKKRYWWVFANELTQEINTQVLEIPDDAYYILNQGIQDEKTFYIPAYQLLKNKPCFFKLKIETPKDPVILEKNELEVDPSVALTTVNLVKKFGNDVYFAGKSQDWACYWKNKKQFKLNNDNISISEPFEIQYY